MHPNDSTAAAAAAPEQDAPAQWAILELMGHQRLAGRVSQQTFGGAQLIRVDVPEVVLVRNTYQAGEPVAIKQVIPAHTRSLGASSIYSINWCDEAAATLSAHSIKHQPINPYGLRSVLEDMPAEQRTKVLALAAPGSELASINVETVTSTAKQEDDHVAF